MYQKIPLFYLRNQEFVTLNGSLVFAVRLNLPSGDGIEDEIFVDDVLAWANFFESVITNEDLYVSLIVEFSLDKKSLFDRYIQKHAGHFLVKEIAEQRCQQLKDHLFRKNTLVFEIPIFRNRDEFFKATEKQIQEKLQAALDRKDILFSAFMDFCQNRKIDTEILSAKEMWNHLFAMINGYHMSVPEKLDPKRSTREQLFLADFHEPEGISLFSYNGRYIGVLSLDMLPINLYAESGYSFFSKLPFEARITVSLGLVNQIEIRKKLAGERKNVNMFVSSRRGSPEIEVNRAKLQAIDAMLAEEKEKIVWVSMTFAFDGGSRKEVEEKMQRIQNLVISEFKTAACYADFKLRHKVFLSSLGYFPSYAYPKHYTFLKSACCLLPLRGHFAGTPEDPLMIFENRHKGVSALTLSSKKQSRWSFLVIGPTGSGKSFLTNHFLLSLLSQDAIIVVFDMAAMSSYAALVELMQGEYIEAKPDGRGISRNVFDFPLGYDLPPERKFFFLENFFSFLLADKQEGLSKEELEFLRRALKRTYEIYMKPAPQGRPEIIEPAGGFEEYAKYGTWIAMRDIMLHEALRCKERGDLVSLQKYLDLADLAHRMAMPVLENLSAVISYDEALTATQIDREIGEKLRRRLARYTESAFKRLFAGKTQFNTRKNFVVVNLGFLRESMDLLIPTYLSYREFFWDKLAVYLDEVPKIMRDILGDEYFVKIMSKNKYIIIDEYHNFNASREVIRLTDKDFRQSRTYGVAIGIITQSLKDVIYEGKDERYSIFESASNRFLLRHMSPENPQMEIVNYVQEKTGMTEKEKELFMSLRFIPGKYSEFFYSGDEIGKGVLRYRPTPLELWINTSHKGERYVRDMLIQKLSEVFKEKIKKDERMKMLIVSQVIKSLAEEYPQGMIDMSDVERENVFNRLFQKILDQLRNEISFQ